MMGPGVLMDTGLNHKQINFAIGKIPPPLLQPVIYLPPKKGGFLFSGDMQTILI